MALFGYDCIGFFRRNHSIMPSKIRFVSLKNSSQIFLHYNLKQLLRQIRRIPTIDSLPSLIGFKGLTALCAFNRVYWLNPIQAGARYADKLWLTKGLLIGKNEISS